MFEQINNTKRKQIQRYTVPLTIYPHTGLCASSFHLCSGSSVPINIALIVRFNVNGRYLIVYTGLVNVKAWNYPINNLFLLFETWTVIYILVYTPATLFINLQILFSKKKKFSLNKS